MKVCEFFQNYYLKNLFKYGTSQFGLKKWKKQMRLVSYLTSVSPQTQESRTAGNFIGGFKNVGAW